MTSQRCPVDSARKRRPHHRAQVAQPADQRAAQQQRRDHQQRPQDQRAVEADQPEQQRRQRDQSRADPGFQRDPFGAAESAQVESRQRRPPDAPGDHEQRARRQPVQQRPAEAQQHADIEGLVYPVVADQQGKQGDKD